MALEDKYLLKALEKAGYVVIVKECSEKNKTGKLVYISPNATNMGMNVSCLSQGIKLTEDYIHPDDRAKVIGTVVEATKTGLADYIHEYRMVGDDGVVRTVSNEISISAGTNSDTTIVECYIKDITSLDSPSSDNKRRLVGTKQATESMEVPDEISKNDKISTLLQIFAELSGLYSVMVDGNRRVIYQPIGPATNMGDFYDLFEKPNYREYFETIKQRIIDENQSLIIGREEGGVGKISVAPVMMGKKIKGYWVIGSYTAEETETLNRIYEYHWYLAGLISDFLSSNTAMEEQLARTKGAGEKLRELKASQGIITETLKRTSVASSMMIDELILETLKDAGTHMAVNDAILYTFGMGETNEYVLRGAWNSSGAKPGQDLVKVSKENFKILEQAAIEERGTLVIDGSTMTETYKLILMRHNHKSIIVQPLFCYGKLYGMLVFAETRTERLWTEAEKSFAASMGLVVQNFLEKFDGRNNLNKVNEQLIDSFNNFNAGVFVRDAFSGEVLFSNDSMNNMMGKNLVGCDSREVITDLRDRFENIGGMRKPFITKEKVVKWRSYIQSVDNIMDITEVQMSWLSGEPASLFILRKAKDL